MYASMPGTEARRYFQKPIAIKLQNVLTGALPVTVMSKQPVVPHEVAFISGLSTATPGRSLKG